MVKSTTSNDYNHTIYIDSLSQEPMFDEKLHAFMIKYLQPLFCSELQLEFNTCLNQHTSEDSWDNYQKINKVYAEAIAGVYNQGDIIWIHDYQLLMVPYFLKQLLPECNIGLSISTKFPYWEHLSPVPGHKELLQSMLQADRIWFQTKSDARHFATACCHFLSLPCPPSSKQIGVLSLPSSNFMHISNYTTERYHYFRDTFANKRIVYCRNNNVADVVRILAAFTQAIANNQHLMDQLVLIQLCSSKVPAAELKGVADIVRQINHIYGTKNSVPVHFYHQEIDDEEEKAIMMASESGVFLGSDPSILNSAKTFVLCHSHKAPIIVSENSTLNIPHGPFTVDDDPTNIALLADCFQSVFMLGKLSAMERFKTLYQYILKNDASTCAKLSIEDPATSTASKSFTQSSSSDDTVYSNNDSPLTSSPEPTDYSSAPNLSNIPEPIYAKVTSPEIPYLTKGSPDHVYSIKSSTISVAFSMNSDKLPSKVLNQNVKQNRY